MPGPIEHFQMRMNNADGSMAFYEYVFGWTFEGPTNNTWKIKSDGLTIGELKVAPPRTRSAIIPFYKVSNVSGVCDAAGHEGGEVITPSIPSPVLGADYTLIIDYENCTIAVFNK